MEVHVIEFPETRVAVAEHRGPPEHEYDTSMKLIEWRIQNGLPPDKNRTYGVHYTDPSSVQPSEHRVDFCVTFENPVQDNSQGVISKLIPANRCALARHIGSRSHNPVPVFLYRQWLPKSGEILGDFPVFFHYVNVGPHVQEHEMITDVYLPLKMRGHGTPA